MKILGTEAKPEKALHNRKVEMTGAGVDETIRQIESLVVSTSCTLDHEIDQFRSLSTRVNTNTESNSAKATDAKSSKYTRVVVSQQHKGHKVVHPQSTKKTGQDGSDQGRTQLLITIDEKVED